LNQKISFDDSLLYPSSAVIRAIQSRYTERKMILVHFDDVQHVVSSKWTTEERISSWIYKAVDEMHRLSVFSTETLVVPFLSGTNAHSVMSLKLGGRAYQFYSLPLLPLDGQFSVLNATVPEYQLDVQGSYELKKFFSLMTGHPVLLGLFMCSASHLCRSTEVDGMVKPQPSDIRATESLVAFSMEGWKNFVSQKKFKNKNMLWSVMADVGEQVFSTRFNYAINPLLGASNNFELCMSVLYHCLVRGKDVKREEKINSTVSDETFASLEESGALFLNVSATGFRPVLPCFFISKIAAKLGASGHYPSFPLLDFQPTIESHTNEEMDLSVLNYLSISICARLLH
jgi:hypothetical protein